MTIWLCHALFINNGGGGFNNIRYLQIGLKPAVFLCAENRCVVFFLKLFQRTHAQAVSFAGRNRKAVVIQRYGLVKMVLNAEG